MVPAEMGTMLAAQLRMDLAKTEIQLKELEVSIELLDRERKLEDERLADNSPDLAVLDRQVELAQADLALDEVRATAAGRVLALLAHPGGVSSGALLTMGDVRSMVARAEVFQTDVIDVAAGDSAEVSILGRRLRHAIPKAGENGPRYGKVGRLFGYLSGFLCYDNWVVWDIQVEFMDYSTWSGNDERRSGELLSWGVFGRPCIERAG
jgi:hypothetical protein